jgi:hypothetical protein
VGFTAPNGAGLGVFADPKKAQARSVQARNKAINRHGGMGTVLAREAADRRARFLQLLALGRTITECCTEVGVRRQTYYGWREKHPDFASRVDLIRAEGNPRNLQVHGWDQGFAKFRETFFGMKSPWFHLEAVRAFETAKGGDIVLLLWPPEHGKTTLLEDYAAYKLAIEPDTRITVVSEGEGHAKKVLRRVRNRMEPDGPARRYVGAFGPFAPQGHINDAFRAQPWGSRYFDVFKKGTFDERDYSMAAGGITTTIAGTRADRVFLDDVQSRRSLAQTEKYVELFRQDVLSRAGTSGATFIVGTRVGMGDVYEALIDSDILDEVIVFPAVNDRGEYLWPERYDPTQYERMKRNAGQAAWERNYQQRPSRAGESAFEEEVLERTKVPLRSVLTGPVTPTEVIIGLDPGFGVNAVVGAVCDKDKFRPWFWRRDHQLRNNQEVLAVVDDVAAALDGTGHHVTDLVIEDKAYQKGLIDDEGTLELARRYGLRVSGHQTGRNKYDDDLGVGAMARSFIMGEVELPGADDALTKAKMDELLGELRAWRPSRGTRLRQDLVMAMWFAWIRWRQRRPTAGEQTTTIRMAGLPYRPTPVVLGGRSR